MAYTFVSNLDFSPGVSLVRPRVGNLSSDPSSPSVGELYFNSSDNALKYRGSDNWYALASKTYVDTVVQGLDPKQSARAASTADVDILSAPATLDGVTLANGDRILLKNQASPEENGIYVFAGAASPLARATDADTAEKLSPGSFVFVEEGTANSDSGFVMTSDTGYILDTDPVTFVQFSGAGQIEAGAGLTKTGNQINVIGTTNRIAVAADSIDISEAYVGQPSITTLGTVATGTWQGSTVAVAYGGTGSTSFTTNEIVIYNGTALVSSGKSITATPQKFAATIGDGSATSFNITHGLGTEDVQVAVWETTGSKEIALVNISIASTNAVTVSFDGAAPATNSYRVVVVG